MHLNFCKYLKEAASGGSRRIRYMRIPILLVLGWGFMLTPVSAQSTVPEQTLPFRKIQLNDLSEFKTTASNWQIAGNAQADHALDGALSSVPGTGVLLNNMDAQNRAHLFTVFEHGDIELETEVLMVKGANSGIYLQGRYEVQLFDSWGKTSVNYADMGGIYQRTDPVTQKGYEGYAPAVNASRAPGLWQKLYIRFKAPEFDAGGRKIADARFEKVLLNGVMLHQEVTVSGPTRSGAFTDEQPLGPLMIQGNHGKVAFRNMRYKRYGKEKIAVSQLRFAVYPTPGDSLSAFREDAAQQEAPTDTLSWRLAQGAETFLIKFAGEMELPRVGSYLFKLQTGGGGMLVVGSDTLIRHDGTNPFDRVVSASYNAKTTKLPFVLVYNKPLQWREGLALFAEGPEVALHELHTPASFFHEPPVEPMLVETRADRATIQRSFIAVGDGKKTHCLSVATPQGTHFTIDLATGSLLQVWDGGFLDATPMWHRRGNQQVAIARGPVIVLDSSHQLVNGHGDIVPWNLVAYTLGAHGLPEFTYSAGKTTITDKLVPEQGRRALARTLRIRNAPGGSVRLASGSAIEALPGNTYLVNEKQYYLTVSSSKEPPVIRKTADGQELWVTTGGKGLTEIQYTLWW